MAGEDRPVDPFNIDWNDGKREESIRLLHDYTSGKAQSAIDWYWKRKWRGWTGRALRLLAILFTTAGGLVPILHSAGIWVAPEDSATGSSVQFFALAPESGYVFVALAAAFIGLDKFFGFSSTWIRFVSTATVLESGFIKFQLEWASLNAARGGQPLTPQDCETLIGRLLSFLTFVRDEVEKETNAWATEYLSNLAALEKQAKQQIQAQTPGGIDLTVENGDHAPVLSVSLDSAPVQSMSGTRCAIKPVFPGQHVVTVSGQIAGAPVSVSSGLIHVAAGQTAAVKLKLG